MCDQLAWLTLLLSMCQIFTIARVDFQLEEVNFVDAKVCDDFVLNVIGEA